MIIKKKKKKKGIDGFISLKGEVVPVQAVKEYRVKRYSSTNS